MNINIRPLNKGETYCCSVSIAKEIFKNTQVKLNFTKCGNEFKNGFEHPIYRYARKTVKGQVIAYFTNTSREKSPLINFFSIKQDIYPDDLKKKFNELFLPEFYNLYSKKISDNALIESISIVIVELYDENIIMHIKN